MKTCRTTKEKNNLGIVFTSSLAGAGVICDLEGHPREVWGAGNALFLDPSGGYMGAGFITNC